MNENQLQVGYCRVDITPRYPVPMSGYGNTSSRFHNNVLDPVYATCVAFTEGENTVLLFTQDLCLCNAKWAREGRDVINEATGIPNEQIMFCSTHTHSAPDMFSHESIMETYYEFYKKAVLAAAQGALADREPAVLYGTKTQTKGLNFIRHYLLCDGTYGGDGFGDFTKGIVDHAAKNDPEMLLVQAKREGKPDVLIMNWQAHPSKTGGSTKYDMSSDFVGAVREQMERRTGMHFAYFTGAAGNHNTNSRIPEERNDYDYLQVGEKLADTAIAALPDMKLLIGSGIKTATDRPEHSMNHADVHLAKEANEVMTYWKESKDYTATRNLAIKLGFKSHHHARAVSERATFKDTGRYEINAGRIGGFAFVTSPFETFCAHGLHVKENSPFDMTMVFSCANQYHSYVPTADAYEYGCYESYTSYFAAGTGEEMAQELVQLLEKVK